MRLEMGTRLMKGWGLGIGLGGLEDGLNVRGGAAGW
jgi:hypothetical protein